MNARVSGFTLIELLITVAIIGILSAVAYPNYLDSVRKSNRASAKARMTEIAQREQKFYSEKIDAAAFTADLKNLSYPDSASIKSESGGHEISVAVPTSTTFTITAKPLKSDVKCGNLTLDHLGTFLPAGC